jgi:hypothetical protein
MDFTKLANLYVSNAVHIGWVYIVEWVLNWSIMPDYDMYFLQRLNL